MFRLGLRQLGFAATRGLTTINTKPLTLLGRGFSKSPLASAFANISAPSMRRLPLMEPILERQQHSIIDDSKSDETVMLDSVLRKRRLKMKKHKLRKRRRLQRALKKRLGKI